MAASAFSNQRNVIYALFMRDLQTRFAGGGGGYLNYLLTLGWPLAHIALLLVIYSALGRAAPMGQDPTIFFATGLVPYMIFYYPTRFMMLSVMMNQPLTNFPIVKVLDIMLARAIIEIITGFTVVCVTAFVLYALGHDIMPTSPAIAVSALAASLLLAVGFGLLNAVIVVVFKPWIFIFILFAIGLYITSGIIFVVSALPEKIQYVLSFNPVIHVVSWFRSAYFNGYETALIPDKPYPIMFGLVSLLTALLGERYVLTRFGTG